MKKKQGHNFAAAALTRCAFSPNITLVSAVDFINAALVLNNHGKQLGSHLTNHTGKV